MGHEAITYSQCLMKLETAYAELEVCLSLGTCWYIMAVVA